MMFSKFFKSILWERKPFIIAEMSGNHNQSIERAYKIIDQAARCGVDAIKFQTATPDGLTLNLDVKGFRIDDPNSPWFGEKLYNLYRNSVMPWEWHNELFEYCETKNLIAFSTPFEEKAVDFLESLNVPCYKIASFENTDLPLIRKVARTGKPMIISTGMATVAELDETVRAAREAGCQDLVLLKCTSTYPVYARKQ
ncbi:N-acetylneuraminate synthase family protein [Arthrospira platensis BEA 1257B]